MVRTAAILQLCRPQNGAMAVLAVLIGAALASEEPGEIGPLPILLLSISAFLAVSFMNAQNDVNDVRTDMKAHPERPLASGAMTQRQGRLTAAILLVSAFAFILVLSVLMIRWEPIAIFSFAMVMDMMYENRCKFKGIAGNVNIGILTGTLFVFGASIISITWEVVLIGAMAASINVAREIIKDIQDRKGDEGSRKTLVMTRGETFALNLSHLFILMGIALSVSLPFISDMGPPAFFPIIIADLVFLYSMHLSRRSPARSQIALKIGMIFAIMGFLVRAFSV